MKTNTLMIYKKHILVISFLFGFIALKSQDAEPVYHTFNSTRVINAHSTETLWKKELDFRVGHRFGDIAGAAGGVQSAFGLDNSADISIGFEYGLTNDLDIGLTRYKGAGPYTQLFEGYAKYKFIRQTSKTPISLVGIAKVYTTGMNASTDSTSANYFTEYAHRMSYAYQLILARKFSERFSFQIMPTYVHRNFVAFDDANDRIAMGAGFRFQVTKLIGVIGEYHYVLKDDGLAMSEQLKDPIGLGIEFNTGGHVFQVNFTNSRGFSEVQYISATTSDITDGEYRLGFTISRIFKL